MQGQTKTGTRPAGIPGWAHYRPAEEAGVRCGTCDYYTAGRCEMFDNAPVDQGYVCDKWDGRVDKSDHEPSYDPAAVQSEWDHDEINGELRDALEPTQKATGKLYLISHAKTRYNQPGQPHDMVQGWRDIPLDATGRQQARTIGKFAKSKGIEKIFSSDLKRAQQTSQIAGRVADIPVVTDPNFKPWNLGDFAGHSSMDVVPKLKPFITSPDKKIPGGESFNDYMKRFIPAVEKILDMVEQGHTIALVTHSRNVETLEGWLGGHGYRKEVDPRAIDEDKIDPATVIEISAKGSKLTFGNKFDVKKAQANAAELRLRVHGMSKTPGGLLSYRMVTKDGHYVGRTNPSRVRARKGDVLKVQANDFLQSANGDLRWDNPNVVSQIQDSPHSWRELCAMAGGAVKEMAADGTDVPAAGDEGGVDSLTAMADASARAAVDGPTMNDVHVNVPLKNISVFYGNRKLKYQIHKADKMKQIAYGVVLEPNVLDSQDDFMLPHHVEKAAHTYLKKAIRGQSSVVKLQHRAQGFKKTKPSIVPVESFIAPVDFSYDGKDTIKAGSWVIAMHVEDPALWQKFLDGEYTGFSIGGTGIRRSFNSNNPDLVGGDTPVPPRYM